MAIINNLTNNDSIINPITGSELVYNADNTKLSSTLGSNTLSADITGTLSEISTDMSDLQSDLNKVDVLISSLNSKGASINADANMNDILTSLGAGSQSISNVLITVENQIELGGHSKREVYNVSKVDIVNMSESDRAELGELLGITITNSTELYVY